MNTMEEPADGTVLLVDDGEQWTIIWRNDAEADRWETQPGERWFDSHDEDPMGLDVYLRDAVAVYALGPKLVDFKAPAESTKDGA